MQPTVTRNIADTAREYLAHFPAILIEGARQVGKSTLTHQLAPEGTFLSLDIPEIAAAVQADPMGAITEHPEQVTIVDEIQYFPELTRAIKAAIDQDRRPGRFILTGSASLFSLRGTQDSLAGRIAHLNLYGFSQGELQGRREDFVARISSLQGKRTEDSQESVSNWASTFTSQLTRDDYIHLCTTGSYPEVQGTSTRTRNVWLDSYIHSIIHRDLGDLRRSVSPERAGSLLKILSVQQASELVKTHVAREIGVPERSLDPYLDLLESVQLTKHVKAWRPNLTKREVNKPKSIVLDSAVALRQSGISERHLYERLYQQQFGMALEGFVIAELLKQQTWSELEFSVRHYRDSAGGEVDVVLETDAGEIIGIEVKAASSYSGGQFTHLAALRDKLGEKFRAGIVLTTSDHGYRYADRLIGLPISALWEL